MSCWGPSSSSSAFVPRVTRNTHKASAFSGSELPVYDVENASFLTPENSVKSSKGLAGDFRDKPELCKASALSYVVFFFQVS